MLLLFTKAWYLLLLYIYFKIQIKCDIDNVRIPECDVSIDSAICINDGQKILLPDAKPYGKARCVSPFSFATGRISH
ncbi:secreted ookinete protein, putative (PSOP17) [Plasmodium ovale wallikeri]|uniref:Secreted ookinete protein, putative (PSOP17) n=1 Tax=Plasmodium ovale wallikeri TaxID=864142 RepID=A0A1A8ZXS7_PLAOA|nr:secreted ookinete protein, putative (PSOP17) [Plasmodium ovale wallikeri]SBT49082.1 secreted ookinete protein, putative (PSOP17) [Plasmodium ovale wallikeri]